MIYVNRAKNTRLDLKNIRFQIRAAQKSIFVKVSIAYINP